MNYVLNLEYKMNNVNFRILYKNTKQKQFFLTNCKILQMLLKYKI